MRPAGPKRKLPCKRSSTRRIGCAALGETGFRDFQEEKGTAETYQFSANQSEAIVSMQLGSLANLERETLRGEHQKLLDSIIEYLRLLSDEANIRSVIRQDMLALKEKYGTKRRTAFSEDELADINRDDLIAEEPMVVTLSQRGYVKRTPLSTYERESRRKRDYRCQVRRRGRCKTSLRRQHARLPVVLHRSGRVHSQKVYDLPLQSRTSRGRAIVNLLSLKDAEERVTSRLAVREFTDEQFLIMATKNGTVKKTALSAYSRPMKGGIIAIKLDEGRTDRRADCFWHRRRRAGHDKWHVDPVFASRCASDGPGHARRPWY